MRQHIESDSEAKDALRRIMGYKKFAFRPTRMTDGTQVFFQYYWVYETGYRDEAGVYGLAVNHVTHTTGLPTRRTSAVPDPRMVRVFAKAVVNAYWKTTIKIKTVILPGVIEQALLDMPAKLRGALLLRRRWGYIGTIDYDVDASIGEIVMSASYSAYTDHQHCDEAAAWLMDELLEQGYELKHARVEIFGELTKEIMGYD